MRDSLCKFESEAVQELLDQCGSGPQIIINDEAADLLRITIAGCDCIACQFLSKCLTDMRDIH